jgi:hypothetical protein
MQVLGLEEWVEDHLGHALPSDAVERSRIIMAQVKVVRRGQQTLVRGWC